MAKVKFIPEPGVSDETEQFGISFAGGEFVEVTDEKALTKFRGNRFFEVEDEATEEQDDDKDAGLKAVHNGGGRYVIKRDGEIIKTGLTKADATAFNAMSDEDKAEYVEL